MRRLVLGARPAALGCVLVFLFGAGSAWADGPDGIPPIPSTAITQNQPPPNLGPPQRAGGQQSAGGPTGGHSSAQPPAAKLPPLIKRCKYSKRHHRGTRTCRYYRARQLVKKCVKKPHHRTKCRRFAARAAFGAAVTGRRQAHPAATETNHGYIQQPLGAIVKIQWTNHAGQGENCSGTLLSYGLILTAGHCVYSNPTDGDGTLGYYDVATYTITPGNTWDSNGNQAAPYGQWKVKNMWTTNDYAYHGVGADWGIIEVYNQQGQDWPGHVAGTASAEWDVVMPSGSYFWQAGYPVAGAFRQAANGTGNLQYFCEIQWDAETSQDPSYDNYYAFKLPCQLTGGASGGPVYVYYSGQWTIVGVDNRGLPIIPVSDTTTLGDTMISFWLNDTFGSLWNYVLGQVNQGY